MTPLLIAMTCFYRTGVLFPMPTPQLTIVSAAVVPSSDLQEHQTSTVYRSAYQKTTHMHYKKSAQMKPNEICIPQNTTDI